MIPHCFKGNCILKLWCDRDYYMAIFISYPILTRDSHISLRAEGPRADMGRRLIWYMMWKLPYHNLFIIHFFLLTFAYLISYTESKARLPSAPSVVIWRFCPCKKKQYHPLDLVICCFFFYPGKKAVSPTWPIIRPFALHKRDMCLKAMLVSHVQIEHTF